MPKNWTVDTSECGNSSDADVDSSDKEVVVLKLNLKKEIKKVR